jgi:hypothetical protein
MKKLEQVQMAKDFNEQEIEQLESKQNNNTTFSQDYNIQGQGP